MEYDLEPPEQSVSPEHLMILHHQTEVLEDKCYFFSTSDSRLSWLFSVVALLQQHVRCSESFAGCSCENMGNTGDKHILKNPTSNISKHGCFSAMRLVLRNWCSTCTTGFAFESSVGNVRKTGTGMTWTKESKDMDSWTILDPSPLRPKHANCHGLLSILESHTNHNESSSAWQWRASSTSAFLGCIKWIKYIYSLIYWATKSNTKRPLSFGVSGLRTQKTTEQQFRSWNWRGL